MKPEPVRCLIVEDEADAALVLERYIRQTPGLERVGCCGSVPEAEALLARSTVELLFVDINLPGTSGIDWLRGRTNTPGVIFTTADASFGAEAFALDAVDYLLKPFSYERFAESLARYFRRAPQPATEAATARPFLMVRVERLLQKIYLDEVRYIEAKRNHLEFFLDSGAVKVYQSMAAIEARLPQPHFLRIHRSFIVAAGRVRGWSASAVQAGDIRLPVGRLYQRAVQAALEGR